MVYVKEEYRYTLDIMKNLEVGDEAIINDRRMKLFIIKEISTCDDKERGKYETCSVCKGRIRLEDPSNDECDTFHYCYSYGADGFPFIELRKNKLSKIFNDILEDI